MKRLMVHLVIGVFAVSAAIAADAPKRNAVTLEVMNPRGVIPPPPFHAPAPRVTDLNGKKIGIYWIGKAGGDNFWDGVAELLAAKYPKAEIKRYRGPFDLGDKMAAQVAKEVDTLFYGVGD
jgi:hypothetical protein